MHVVQREKGCLLDDNLRALLRRCRHALAVGGPEWERDVDTAIANDMALVADIDAMIGE